MLLFQLSSLLWRMSEAATQSCSVKKSALENFAKLTGNHLCQILLFNKVVGIRSVTLLKKRLRHRVFPVNFAKFSRTPFFQNTSCGCVCYISYTQRFFSVFLLSLIFMSVPILYIREKQCSCCLKLSNWHFCKFEESFSQ